MFNGRAFAPEGEGMAWTGSGPSENIGSVWVTDLIGGKPNKLGPMSNNWPDPLAWSPDGKSIAVVTEGGAVWIIDAETGKDRVPLPGLTGRVWHAAFTPDRKQVIGRDGFHELIWDAATSRLLRRLPDHLPDREH